LQIARRIDNRDEDSLVDDLFYYSHNHDVWLAGSDADAHYHAFGWKEARDPAAGVDPLGHFLTFGIHE
jgi:hypothetical protein